MHAFLIIGTHTEAVEKEVESRIQALHISAWDVIRIPEEGTIGIDVIRDFERNLSLAPRNSPSKAGIIPHMERLTVEAQNALLKTLEEPPPHTYIIGTTVAYEALLPTVRSRMSVVRMPDHPRNVDATLLKELLSLPVGKRLQKIDAYTATRDDAKKFVASLLSSAERELVSHPSRRLATLVRNLLTAQSQLSVNVNPRLVVDDVFLGV